MIKFQDPKKVEKSCAACLVLQHAFSQTHSTKTTQRFIRLCLQLGYLCLETLEEVSNVDWVALKISNFPSEKITVPIRPHAASPLSNPASDGVPKRSKMTFNWSVPHWHQHLIFLDRSTANCHHTKAQRSWEQYCHACSLIAVLRPHNAGVPKCLTSKGSFATE